MMDGMKKPKEAVMPKLRSFTTRLPADTIRALKVHAAQTGGSVQTIIADAIEVYLKAHKRGV
jgi:predicted DNA binding CopG/RHH family protein